MSARLTIVEAVELADRHGLVAYEQRGFYSHFLRIRTAAYETLATPDIRRGSVSRRALTKAVLASIAELDVAPLDDNGL